MKQSAVAKTPIISTEVRRPAVSIPNPRTLWAIRRAAMESVKAKSQPRGNRFKRRWELFQTCLNFFGVFLRLTGLFRFGEKNVRDVRLVNHTLNYPSLPNAFEGYRILHLTDLHLDFVPGIENYIVKAIEQIQEPIDLAIITGDFREHMDSGFDKILKPLSKIVSAIPAKDGIYATLGNHDTINMVPGLESQGIYVLGNETITLQRNGQSMSFTGIDDVHYFYTEHALDAVQNSPDHFKLLFAHSAEFYYEAEKNNYRLYLAGHTHGGQICLPGGYPLITHHTAGRKRARGFWKENKMIGYTSQGGGAIGLPVRFFSHGEVTLFTLRKSPV